MIKSSLNSNDETGIFKNIIKGISGEAISPNFISDSVSYYPLTNNIKWIDLYNGKRVKYLFKKQINIGKSTANFTGNVVL